MKPWQKLRKLPEQMEIISFPVSNLNESLFVEFCEKAEFILADSDMHASTADTDNTPIFMVMICYQGIPLAFHPRIRLCADPGERAGGL
jgi:hypothetical protein